MKNTHSAQDRELVAGWCYSGLGGQGTSPCRCAFELGKEKEAAL